MAYRCAAALMVLVASVPLVPLAAQAPPASAGSAAAGAWTVPRTPDGHPDFQGVWSYATLTPLERPAEFAGKEFLTEQEAAAYEKRRLVDNNMDRRDGGAEADVTRAYNDFWWDRGTKVVVTRRTSLVVDPPDGRIPPLTPEARKRAAARTEARRLRPADGPEDRPLMERCILFGAGGAPMLPTAYNNNAQFIQTRDQMVIVNEMVHEVRIIALDGRPRLPGNVRQWLGDSHGRWEGDTLVVETANFTDKSNFRGSSENLRLTERFTRVAEDTLLYEFTVDDPTSFTRPWRVELPLWKSPELLYEYACHEGNTGMAGVLAGFRKAEAEEAAGQGTR
jgi:hypothetical protein